MLVRTLENFLVYLTVVPCQKKGTLIEFHDKVYIGSIEEIQIGGPMPRVLPSILFAAPHAQEGGTMAGLLLLVDGHLRGKSGRRSLSFSYRCIGLGQYYKGWSRVRAESHRNSLAVDIGYNMDMIWWWQVSSRQHRSDSFAAAII
jgi:hypothetical protein